MATIQPPETALMGRHLEHLRKLHAQGVVRDAGRAGNGDHGLCAVEAPHESQARAIAESDPAVAEGPMRLEPPPFQVVFDAPAAT